MCVRIRFLFAIMMPAGCSRVKPQDVVVIKGAGRPPTLHGRLKDFNADHQPRNSLAQ
jgi:hypothetical protein